MLTKARLMWALRMLPLLILPITMVVFAEADTPRQSQEANRSFADRSIETYRAWLNAPWTSSDAPYQAIRSKIDTDLTNDPHPMSVVNRYQEEFARASTDPRALFAYCYCVYESTKLPNGVSYTDAQMKSDVLYTSVVGFYPMLPHTYNYARLAFLQSAPLKDTNLISVGKRLLKHSPGDVDVESSLGTILTFSKIPSDRKMAVYYQQDLEQRFPKDPRTYNLLGIIYYRNAWITHSLADADKSIEAYRRAYKLSPQDKDTQHRGELIIKFIQDLKTRWQQAETTTRPNIVATRKMLAEKLKNPVWFQGSECNCIRSLCLLSVRRSTGRRLRCRGDRSGRRGQKRLKRLQR